MRVRIKSLEEIDSIERQNPTSIVFTPLHARWEGRKAHAIRSAKGNYLITQDEWGREYHWKWEWVRVLEEEKKDIIIEDGKPVEIRTESLTWEFIKETKKKFEELREQVTRITDGSTKFAKRILDVEKNHELQQVDINRLIDKFKSLEETQKTISEDIQRSHSQFTDSINHILRRI